MPRQRSSGSSSSSWADLPSSPFVNADFSLLSPDHLSISPLYHLQRRSHLLRLPRLRRRRFLRGRHEESAPRPAQGMYLSSIITTVLYVAIALGVYGMLPLDEVIAAGNTAIAAAAAPILGNAGFVIMTISACFSTSSAVNSQFFSTSAVVAYLAKIGQFPPVLGNKAGPTATSVSSSRPSSSRSSRCSLICRQSHPSAAPCPRHLHDGGHCAPRL